MKKALNVHHTINILLMILLLFSDYFNTINLTIAIIIILLILINSILLIRLTRKKEDKIISENSEKLQSQDLSTLPLFLFFIFLSIHNILTKDSKIALSFSILSLIVFIFFSVLEIRAYLKHRRKK